MSWMHGNDTVPARHGGAPAGALRLLCAALILCGGVSAQDVRMITSNDVLGLAGNGDTIWLNTVSGLNVTIDSVPTAGKLSWQGFTTTSAPWGLTYGGAIALAFLESGDPDIPNRLWTYDHAAGTATEHTLNWNRDTYSSLPADTQSLVSFICYDAAWAGSAFWLACLDGKAVRWEPGNNDARVYVPGRAQIYPIGSFPDLGDTSLAFPDTANRVVAVDAERPHADSTVIWVAALHRVWSLAPGDTLWDSASTALAQSDLQPREFLDVHVNNTSSPPGVFASIVVENKQDEVDTSLFKYDRTARRWVRLYKPGRGAPAIPASVSFGLGRFVYVADQKGIYIYRDTLGTAHLPLISPIAGGDADAFQSRMEKAAAGEVIVANLSIRDVLCLPTPGDSTVRTWIATSDGLFFSRADQPHNGVFDSLLFVKRAPAIESGLNETYVYPGILALDRHWYIDPDKKPEVRFAYSLSKDAKVTIRIYDYNMDLVRTVVDGESRRAGSSRSSGRSSQPADSWDGTNRYGKTVAPGVYYYKITTSLGGRAFGKIIVALSR